MSGPFNICFEWGIVRREAFKRRRSWPISMYYPNKRMVELMKTTKCLSEQAAGWARIYVTTDLTTLSQLHSSHNVELKDECGWWSGKNLKGRDDRAPATFKLLSHNKHNIFGGGARPEHRTIRIRSRRTTPRRYKTSDWSSHILFNDDSSTAYIM